MIIDCISDLHGFKPKLDGGDLLIVAGDLTAKDTLKEFQDFMYWLDKQDYDRIIVIAGNHDGCLESDVAIDDGKSKKAKDWFWDFQKIIYLEDQGCTYKDLKIWGSPWTPTFLDWHFMKDRGDPIKQKWDMIPDDTDILITHGPPFGVQDFVKISGRASRQAKGCAGCEELREAILRIKPKLHVFGHIHESPGVCKFNGILCVNATIMDELYYAINRPIRITYDGKEFKTA